MVTLPCPEWTAPSCGAQGGAAVPGGNPGPHPPSPAPQMLEERPFLPKRSCSPSRPLEPSRAGRADPCPAWSTAPQRGRGAERLHSASGKSSEAGHEGFEDPSSGFWLQTPRHTLGRGSGGLFPLAEPEIQQALVLHMRGGSLGHHRQCGGHSGAGPGTIHIGLSWPHSWVLSPRKVLRPAFLKPPPDPPQVLMSVGAPGLL